MSDCDSSSRGMSGRNRCPELLDPDEAGGGESGLRWVGTGFDVGAELSYSGRRATGTFFNKVGSLGSKPDVLLRGTESFSS